MISDGNVHKEGRAISDLTLLLDLLAFSLIPASRADSSSLQKDIEHLNCIGVWLFRKGREEITSLC
jgi:hypothetical protein